MANRVKGEVGFSAGGRELKLHFSTNALCELEDKLGSSVAEIGNQLGEGMQLKLLRTVFWAGLQGNDKAPDEKAAGDIIDELGFEEVGKLIRSAFELAFPEAANATADPQKKAA